MPRVMKPSHLVRALLIAALLAPCATGQTYREAPALAALVKAGKLPPVDQRLPDEPLVIHPGSYGMESIGRYGGFLARDATTTPDVQGASDLTVPFYGDLSGSRQLKPLAWKSYESADHYRTWTFHLRRGMKWSDGHPYTADDVLFWYEDFVLNKELSPITLPWLLRAAKTPRLEKLDDWTVRFTFEKPYLNFAIMIAYGTERGILATPKHYLTQFHKDYADADTLAAKVKAAGLTNWMELWDVKHDQYYNRNTELPSMCPWIIRTPVPANPAVYVRNPYYYAVDAEGNQLPYIDEQRWTIVGNPERTKLRFLTGAVTFQRIKNLESLELFGWAQRQGKVRVGLIPEWRNYNSNSVVFNFTTPDPFKAKLFNDRRFRRAISLQMPRDLIAEIIYAGMVRPKQIGIGDPAHPWYNEKLATADLAYDLPQANRLLDEMGLTQRNADGIRLDDDGEPIQLNFGTWNTVRTQRATEIICEHLPKVGLTGNFRVVGYDRIGDVLQKGEWEVFSVEDVTGLPIHWPGGMESMRPSQWNAYPWHRWLASGGAVGVEPPAEMVQLWQWWEEANLAASEEELAQAIDRLQSAAAEQMYAVGITSFAPQLRVMDPNVRNVPLHDPWFLYSVAYFEPTAGR